MLHDNNNCTAQHSTSYEQNTILSLMHCITLPAETSASKIRFENVEKKINILCEYAIFYHVFVTCNSRNLCKVKVDLVIGGNFCSLLPAVYKIIRLSCAKWYSLYFQTSGVDIKIVASVNSFGKVNIQGVSRL